MNTKVDISACCFILDVGACLRAGNNYTTSDISPLIDSYISQPVSISFWSFNHPSTVTGGNEEIIMDYPTDHLGSFAVITDVSGNIVQKCIYDAWGNREFVVKDTALVFDRGYTGHEHLDEFGLINMNGRMYDPIVGRFLSPDPYVQAPNFSQSFNRYSYCLNNPLIYTDPTGEWGWLSTAIGAVYGYFSYAIMNKDWGWKAALNGGLTGVMWGLGYTGQVEAAGTSQLWYAGQSAITSTVNSFMPSMSVPISNNFSTNISLGLGVGPNGLAAGVNFSGTYHNEKVRLSAGIGAGTNTSSWGISITDTYGYGISYYRTTYGSTAGAYGGSNPQTVGGIGLHFDNVSFRLENDFFGDRHDRWRSNAFELEVYGFVFGNYIYNNDPKGEGSKVDYEGTDRRGNLHPLRNNPNPDKRKGAWVNGQTYYSPWYVGYRNGSQVLRIGYSHPSAQDLTQNNVHRLFSPGYQNYYNRYDHFTYSTHYYFGYYNPYSLW